MSGEIYNSLAKIGITEDFIDLPMPRNPLKRGELAQISWQVNGEDFYYKCDKQERFLDNLGVISKVIAQESYAIRNGLKSFGQVMNQFKIGYDGHAPKTKTPREIIGIEESCKDLGYISYVYKKKAKALHSDTGGSDKDMAELNEAFNSLKREL